MHKETGKTYVGQTVRKVSYRIADHVRQAKNGRRSAISCAIAKYGLEAFEVTQVEQLSSPAALNQAECDWIDRLNCLAPNGYNLKGGGQGAKYSLETRRKMSANWHRHHKPWTKDQRDLHREACTGWKHTEETRRVMTERRLLSTGMTYELAQSIRAEAALKPGKRPPIGDLAEKYGYSKSVIQRIVANKTWTAIIISSQH